MEPCEAEGIAEARYRASHHDGDEPVSIFRLIREDLGPDAIVRPPRGVAGASTFKINGRRVIALPSHYPLERKAFAAAHEYAHVLLERARYSGPDEERLADYIGAALIAPRRAFVRAFKTYGFDLTELADEFVASQTSMALRIGEVTGVPTAVVCERVRVRGEDWTWGDELELRLRASVPECMPGIRRVRITDRKRGVLLVAAG